MKSRKNQIFKLSIEYCHDDIEKKARQFMDELLENRAKKEQAFFSMLSTCFRKALDDGKKVRYIVFFALRSSILTRSHEMMLALYDERFYGDPDPVVEYFVPTEIMDGFDTLFESLTKEIEKRFIRVNKIELAVARVNLELYYYSIFTNLLLFMSFDMMDLPEAREMREAGIVQVLAGEYMGKTTVLYDSEKAKEVQE